VGGILFDAVTFRWAIMFIVALEFIAFILLALFLLKAARDIYGTLDKLLTLSYSSGGSPAPASVQILLIKIVIS
jgi:hypothetical protein